MELLKKTFFSLLGLTVIVWSFYIVLTKPAPAKYQETKPVSTWQVNTPDGQRIIVELANTPEKRERGLSSRDLLETGHGLLFIFDTPGTYGFWMKDMRFPIDIVWIDENWQIIAVERNVSPETFPQIFTPEKPIRYALELNAGEAEIFGIDTGGILSFGTSN